MRFINRYQVVGTAGTSELTFSHNSGYLAMTVRQSLTRTKGKILDIGSFSMIEVSNDISGGKPAFSRDDTAIAYRTVSGMRPFSALSGEALREEIRPWGNTETLGDIYCIPTLRHGYLANRLCVVTTQGSIIRIRDLYDGTLYSREMDVQYQLSRRLFPTISPDGAYMIVGEDVGSMSQIWSLIGSVMLTRLKTGFPEAAAFAHNNTLVAIAPKSTLIHVWDFDASRKVATLTGHAIGPSSLVWSPDNKYLFSGSADGTIRIWDVAAKKEVDKLEIGHDPGSIAISPDGNFLAYTGDGLRDTVVCALRQ